ncbi:hypothetical protein ISCGN_024058 [Ixodes scapularis]
MNLCVVRCVTNARTINWRRLTTFAAACEQYLRSVKKKKKRKAVRELLKPRKTLVCHHHETDVRRPRRPGILRVLPNVTSQVGCAACYFGLFSCYISSGVPHGPARRSQEYSPGACAPAVKARLYHF